MGREVTKTPDTKLRGNTRRHDGQEPTLLYYATQNVVRALTYAVQGPARTLTFSLDRKRLKRKRNRKKKKLF